MDVSRTEFEAHQNHVDQRFITLDANMTRGFAAIAEQFRTLSTKFDQQQRPNYNLLLGIIGVGLTLASFAGAIVFMSNSHVDELSKARDIAIIEQLEGFRTGSNRWSYDQHQDYAKAVQSDHERVLVKIENLLQQQTELRGDIRGQGATLKSWIDELNQRGKTIDDQAKTIARLEERIDTLRKSN